MPYVHRYRCAAIIAITSAANLAVAQTSLTVDFKWRDQAGMAHGFEGLQFEAFEAEVGTANLVQSYGQRDLISGMATWTVARTEADGMLEPVFQTNGRIAGVVNLTTSSGVESGSITNTAVAYRWPNGANHYSVAQGGAHNFDLGTFSGTAAASRALISSQTFLKVHNYMKNVVGFDPSEILHGYELAGSAAFYRQAGNGLPGRIYIAGDDYRDFDVLSHEYMHHVTQEASMSESPGGSHSWLQDNIRRRDNFEAGKKLAWSEGLVTALGIEALRQSGVGALPLTARDTWYNDDSWDANGALSGQNVAANMELHQFRLGATGAPVTRFSRAGEGEELSIARTVWDLMDSNADALQVGTDTINYGMKGLWDRVLTANGGAATATELWDNLVSDLNSAEGRTAAGIGATNENEAKALAGAIFADTGIAAHTLTNGIVNIANDSNDLYAQEQNTDNSEWFRAALFDTSWNFVDWTDPARDSRHVDPSAGPSLLEFIRFDIGELAGSLTFGEDYFWLTMSNPAGPFGAALDFQDMSVFDFDATGDLWYWGAAQRITVIPAPGSLVLAFVGGLTVLRRRRPA